MGTPVIIDFKEGDNPYADEKPAQKRLTQSQMRADRKQKSNERKWAKSEAKEEAKERKAIAQAKKDGTGLVLPHRPKKASSPSRPKRTAGKAIAKKSR